MSQGRIVREAATTDNSGWRRPAIAQPVIAPTAITPPVIVEAMPVGRLFSGEFKFVLPWFQRAYAWVRERRDIDEARAAVFERHFGGLLGLPAAAILSSGNASRAWPPGY